MCGICGVFNPLNGLKNTKTLLDHMIDALAHRGPDGRGQYIDEQMALGHARLAIIDLTGGRQPLYNEDQSVVLICNGEIYNYRELQRRLMENGHRFQTASDSEVILHLWEDYGKDCLQKLRGMFAFALYDKKQQVLFGARDRFGQKPFFYCRKAGTFSFASEIKALLAASPTYDRLNLPALDQFLFYQFVPHPHTLFENIHQLPPAHCFQVDAKGLRLKRYWQNDIASGDGDTPESHHLDHLEKVLTDAVKCHMVSDVPVGLFLSGGIDSSLIGALASQESEMPLQSFCITYPGHRYDESYFAQLASRTLGTEHHEYPFEPRNLEDTIQGVIRHFDQPLADKAALPLAYLSQKTAQSVKVVLTGDGGDELFAGYDKYLQANHPSPQNSFWHRLPDRWITSQNLMACAPDPFGFRRLKVRLGLKARPFWQSNYYKNAWEGWDRYRLYTDEIREKLGRQFEALDQMRKRPPDPQRPLEYMLALDQKAYLPDDLLLKTDYCTMAFGLEARAPFLDHLVAEAAARLPDALRVSAATGKIALRKLAARHLPTKLVQKPKRGFSVPLKRWFRNELKNWMVDCLVENSVTSGRYFRPQIVKQTVDQHLSGRQNHAQKLLTLIVFELWHRHYFQ